jgi:hypothetical protein
LLVGYERNYNKRMKQILIALNIFIIIGIYVSLDDDPNNNDLRNKEISNLNDLYKVHIQKKDKVILLEKKHYDWEVIFPINWSVDKFAISNFITLFSHLKFKHLFKYNEILDRGEVLQDYGIDSNSTILTLSKNEDEIIIKIGKKTRDEQAVYCEINFKHEQATEIWRVSSQILDLISPKFSNWLDSKLIRTNLYQIDKISTTFKSPNGTISVTSLQKNKEGEWVFTLPFKAKANNENVRLLLNRLLSEQIIDFTKDKKSKLIENDLINNWSVKLEIKSNDSNHLFHLSEPIQSDSKFIRFCMSSYSNHIFKVRESIVLILSDWSTNLRERKIVRLKKNEIKSIEIKNKNGVIKLDRIKPDYWTVIEDNNKSFPGDRDQIFSLIDNLNNIEVKEFVSFKPTETSTGNSKDDNSTFKVQVENLDTTFQTIIIQSNPSNASLWKTLLVEESLWCLIDENLVKTLHKKSYEYKDRIILKEKLKLSKVQIIKLENNETLYDSDLNTTSSLTPIFENLKVQSFLNDNNKIDGTWLKGDWVPWSYKIILNSNSEGNGNSTSYKLYITEQLSPDQWLGSLLNDKHTFNMSLSTISDLGSIINP